MAQDNPTPEISVLRGRFPSPLLGRVEGLAFQHEGTDTLAIMARAKEKLCHTSDPQSDRFPSESRAHVAKLAAEGRGREALAESAKLLGADISRPVKFRLISVGGLRVS